jgi:hypothetical protein
MPACPRSSARSIRRRPYGANTCSLHCGHSHSHSARSQRSGSHARSCCSRTTTASTGRSTGPSQPELPYSERRCASALRRTPYAPAGQASSRARPRCARPPSMRQLHACWVPAARATATIAITTPALDRCPVALGCARARVTRQEIERGSRVESAIVAVASAPDLPQARAHTTGRPRGGPLKNRRRPTLPGPCGPSTIGAEGLNYSVRNGKRCFPLAKATGKRRETASSGPSKLHSATGITNIRQALDPLVPVSFGRYRSSRSGLSTWWSTRGLTPSRGWENLS